MHELVPELNRAAVVLTSGQVTTVVQLEVWELVEMVVQALQVAAAAAVTTVAAEAPGQVAVVGPRLLLLRLPAASLTHRDSRQVTV